MDIYSNSGNEWPNPKRLKTLASNVQYAEGNNLLHQFVLDNSPLHRSHSESYLNAHLRTISSSSLDVNALNWEGYSPLHLAVLKNNLLMTKKLLSCLSNIDVNTRCHYDENTALHLAANLGHLDIVAALLDKEACVDIANTCGDTALCLAARSGHLGIIQLLVRKGANVNPMGCNAFPLHWAVESGNLESVIFLVSNGADLSARDMYRETVLHCAAQSDNLAITEFLLSNGADIDAETEKGWTPLCYAARYGHLGTIKFLLDRGANLDIKSKSGHELFLCAIESGDLETIEFLIDNGADLNTKNGSTPLFKAIKSGNLAVVECLVRKGADVNARDISHDTPLHYAARENLEILQLLLKNSDDSDINAKDKFGGTPLHNAVYKGKIEIAKVLLDNGADFNAVHRYCEPLLHHAVSSRHLGSVALLLDKGADVNAKDVHGQTLLHTAVKEESTVEITKMLIERGADVNVTDNYGRTPLHHLLHRTEYCIEYCDSYGDKLGFYYKEQIRKNLKKFRLLLEGNADVNIKDKKGETPLCRVMRSKNSEIIELFSKGASKPEVLKTNME